MRDTPDQHNRKGEDDAPMTILALKQGYWLFEGEELLNDMLFGRGIYPFKVRCVIFDNAIELNRFVGGTVSVATLWRINPDVVDRLRNDNLLIEIFSTDV